MRSAEEVLCSRGRVKVLKVVMRHGEVNITRIVRETGLNHKTVKNHLMRLAELGIVNERSFGRAKLYSVNYRSPRVLVLRDILFSLEGQ